MNFFGREDLIESLMSLWGKRVGSLCTCRGRRRIGKSTLIEIKRKGEIGREVDGYFDAIIPFRRLLGL